MLNNVKNPCVRCGKERVVIKTWQEQVGTSVLTYTRTSCPDGECQKIVEAEFAAQKAKSEYLAKQRAAAKLERSELAKSKKLPLDKNKMAKAA